MNEEMNEEMDEEMNYIEMKFVLLKNKIQMN
jgi:hypothetical protein